VFYVWTLSRLITYFLGILCSIMHILRIDSLVFVHLISGNNLVVNRQPLADILNRHSSILKKFNDFAIGLTSVSLWQIPTASE
jgi:hypothetical protein